MYWPNKNLHLALRRRVVTVGGLALMAVGLLVISLMLLGRGDAAASSGCGALGGSVVSGECQITGSVVASGTFNVGETLHILNGGFIDASGGGITLDVAGDVIMDIGARIKADGTPGSPSTPPVPGFVTIIADGIAQIAGPTGTSNSEDCDYFAVSANPPSGSTDAPGGAISIFSLRQETDLTDPGIVVVGCAFEAGANLAGNQGGTVDLRANQTIYLIEEGPTVRAVGDYENDPETGFGKGGNLRVRSYRGSVVWFQGAADVRPTGSEVLPAEDRGTIEVTFCNDVPPAPITTFQTNGEPTSPEFSLQQTCEEILNCPNDLLISNYRSYPAHEQFVDIANVSGSTIKVDNCSFVAFDAYTELSIGDATVSLSGYLNPGETFRVGSAGVNGVDAVIADNALPSNLGGLAVMDTPPILEIVPPADGTPVTELLPNNVTGLVYIDSTMVYGVSHLRVPEHNSIYECIYGGSGTGPFIGPFTPLESCFP